MDRLRKFDFFLDGNIIIPRDLHYNFSTKILTYNIEIPNNYLENHDGRFHFIADFDNAVIFDVKLDKKTKSIVSSSFTNQVLFDGFNDESTGKDQTKSLFLKSLKQIKDATDDADQIKRAQEQDSVIKIDVFKCLRNYGFEEVRPAAGSNSGFHFRMNNNLFSRSPQDMVFGSASFDGAPKNREFGNATFGAASSSAAFGCAAGSDSDRTSRSQCRSRSGSMEAQSADAKPVFVETSQVNATKWKTVDCTKDGRLMTVEIVFHIIDTSKAPFSVI